MLNSEIYNVIKEAYSTVDGSNPSREAFTQDPNGIAREARLRTDDPELRKQITVQAVREFLRLNPTAQIHKQVRKRFRRSVTYAKNVDDNWQTGNYVIIYSTVSQYKTSYFRRSRFLRIYRLE